MFLASQDAAHQKPMFLRRGHRLAQYIAADAQLPQSCSTLSPDDANTAFDICRVAAAGGPDRSFDSWTGTSSKVNRKLNGCFHLRRSKSQRSTLQERHLPSDPGPPAANLDEFEAVIRPILQRTCVECHGEETQEGNIRIHTLNPDLLHGNDIDWWMEKRNRGKKQPPITISHCPICLCRCCSGLV